MKFSNIVLLPDLLHCQRAASEGLFAFIREPIHQGCGIDPKWPPTANKPSALLPGFDLHTFRELAGSDAMNAALIRKQARYNVPVAAVDYLFAHMPSDALVLSYDIPPWLAVACAHRGIAWIDIRPSPLAFGRDLYMALCASDAALQKRLADLNVPTEEFRLEAALLEANLHAHRLDVEEGFRYTFSLDACLVFVGQHPEDMALLQPNGQSLQCKDFSQNLQLLAQEKTVLHLLDTRNLARSALFGQHQIGGLDSLARQERESLQKILGRPVKACQQNIYQVLSSHDDVELVGISSPALQEAPWFGKKAHTLFQPYTPLTNVDTAQAGYLQVRFNDILKPVFWHSVLSPEKSPPKIAALPNLERNQARIALNNWGGYEQVMTWERPLHHASFERSGGGQLRKRIENLERSLKPSPSTDTRNPSTTMREKIRALKDTKQGKTAYVLGNAPSLNELNLSALLQVDSFWCNRAFEIEKEGINFLPKYYFLSDRMGFQKFGNRVMAITSGMKFFREEAAILARQRFPEEYMDQNIISYGDIPSSLMFEGTGNFSTDPSIEVNPSFTVILDAVQFAFYMGFEQVYVGGVDLDYSGKPYFFDENISDAAPRDAWTENMKKSFIVAKQHFERHDRILAKITKSPKLPLDFIAIEDNLKKQ